MAHPPDVLDASDADAPSSLSRYLAPLVHLPGFLLWAIGPAVPYLLAESPFVKEHARQALNWHLTFGTAFVVFLIAAFLVSEVFVFPAVLVAFAYVPLMLLFGLTAMVKAFLGQHWAYPYAYEFL